MKGTSILTAALTILVLHPAPLAASEDSPFSDHVTLTASDRIRGEFVSWFDPAGPKSNSDYSFLANRLRFGGTASFSLIEVVVEGQDTRLVNLPGADSINTGTGTANVGPLGPGANYFANTRRRDQGEIFLHLGYATLRNFGIPGLAGRVGRFGYNSGLEKPAHDATLLWLQRNRLSQRLIGNFDYTNVGRSFDGVEALYDHGPFNLTLMGSHPTAGGFNVNANKEIDKVDLVGATMSLVEPEAIAPTAAQFFYMYYGDRRELVVTDSRARDLPSGQSCASIGGFPVRSCDQRDLHLSTIGADLVHSRDVGPGRADLLAWGAVQFGDWESLRQKAWAYVAEAGYQLPDTVLKPWLRLGFARGSGDHDRRDGKHGTFFQILPTARLYALFPFYNMMNNQDLFVQGILRPLDGASIAMSGHWLRATESSDLWYAGGGATSNTSFGYAGIDTHGRHELGYLTDLELSYSVNKHLAFYGYYGHAFGQGIVAANFSGSDADYGYIEATLSL